MAGVCVQRMHMREHLFKLLRRAFFEVIVSGASVVKIGQHDKVADSGKAPCHIVQLFAFAWGIHIKQDNGEGAVFFGVDHEAVHQAVSGWDVDVVFNHVCLLVMVLAHCHKNLAILYIKTVL